MIPCGANELQSGRSVSHRRFLSVNILSAQVLHVSEQENFPIGESTRVAVFISYVIAFHLCWRLSVRRILLLKENLKKIQACVCHDQSYN